MTTKAELELELKILKEQLEAEQSRPTGHKIEGVSIDMGANNHKIAVAKAVKEGMKALQALGDGDSYGIYLDGAGK